MARFSRIKILIEMRKIGLIPVFYNNDIEVSKKILKACAEGGAVCIEMTNRGDGAIKIFSELVEYCEKEIPQVILGMGSIVDALTGALYINYGANFIVGPEIDRELAILCNKRKIPYMPGCGTVTEIQKAHSLGVEFCKIFPGDLIGGPAFVKAVKGPCPWTFIMPTGGVCTTKESLTEWFSAGVVCVGIGSKLITKELVENRDYKKIASEVRRVINLIKEIRDSLEVSESF
ncbi:MAG: bifunctional 4-hydroxy-2-oxoglutarate aldolase/2-dehydro-3-deoxy-phosphogluconate aldolase [Actinobacteria bacterium]|nr:bifunctional 4-hydroxy-2-oxoglutarate aldolase/2-dehydro-3-deoxy-phosphogluconate aldolase [Actinomycetota bacterium]